MLEDKFDGVTFRYVPILLAALALTGCALTGSRGDLLLAERNFGGARDEYLAVLEKRDSGLKVEKALFHLGLIYLQPDPELYAPDAAEEVLTRLTYIRPRSQYAARAAALLALQLETVRLRNAFETEREAGRQSQQLLASLRQEASATEALSEDHSKEVSQLSDRIARLQGQIAKLREELEATGSELTDRERELERLKSIDLAEP